MNIRLLCKNVFLIEFEQFWSPRILNASPHGVSEVVDVEREDGTKDQQARGLVSLLQNLFSSSLTLVRIK